MDKLAAGFAVFFAVAVAPCLGAQPTATHTISFKNNCGGTLWLATFGNGASKSCTTNADCNGAQCANKACVDVACSQDSDCTIIQFCDQATCTSDNDCPAITCTASSDCPVAGQSCVSGHCSPTCLTSGQCACGPNTPPCPGPGATCTNNRCGGGVCRYENISPGFWMLQPGAAPTTITAPTGWGGRFWGRTGCPDNLNNCNRAGATCTKDAECCNLSCVGPQGQKFCNPGVPACKSGDCQTQASCAVSGDLPASLFEANFTDAGVVWYDVSFVDSYNLSIQAIPVDNNGQPRTDGDCHVAGCANPLAAGPVAALAVSTTCSSNADCFLGKCVQGRCTAGYLSPCNKCESTPNAPGLDCSTPETNQYCCASNVSCNLETATCFADNDCLSNKCVNFVCQPPTKTCASNTDCTTSGYVCDAAIQACVPGSSLAATCCGPVNPDWMAASALQSYVTTFKNACPTGYTYQFDDPSSLFTCDDTGQGVNFNVTFCP